MKNTNHPCVCVCVDDAMNACLYKFRHCSMFICLFGNFEENIPSLPPPPPPIIIVIININRIMHTDIISGVCVCVDNIPFFYYD